MDRDDLLTILDALEDGGLGVTPGGMLVDGNANEYDPDEAMAELGRLVAGAERLRKVLTWAKQAPV